MLKLICFLLLFSVASYSQSLPEIRQGNTLAYTVYADGDELPLILVVDSLAPAFIKLGWAIEGLGSGKWIMTKNSIENANRGFWGEPMADTEQQLPDDQTVLLLSKAQLNALNSNEPISYDGETYTNKPLPADQKFTLEGAAFNTLYLENANGSSKIWVLDNAPFPAIVKFMGNPAGIDIQLKSIR